jgi:hypothetical protein
VARAHVIRDLRPGRDKELKEFRRIVSAQIPVRAPCLSNVNGRLLARAQDVDVRVELTWELQDVDLDLYASFPDNTMVNYQNLREDTSTGLVQLERDVLNAPGPEIMRLSGADVVVIGVHAYSNHGLGEVGARIRVISGTLDETIPLIPSPDNVHARWCRVMVIAPERIEILEEYSSLAMPG